MSDQKSFQTSQYIPVTIAELKSASDTGNAFETANGIKFTNVEIIGVVQRVSTKDDGGVTISIGSSFKPDPDIIYTFSGKFTDEPVVDTMNRIRQYAIVILRGKFTMYVKDNEQRIGVNPHQIVELEAEGGRDAMTRELWLYKLIATRVANKFPVIVGDDIHFIMNRDGIAATPFGNGMVIVNPSAAVSGGTTTPAPAPTQKPTPVAIPAPKPAMPQKIATAPNPVTKTSPPKTAGDKNNDEMVTKIITKIVETSGSSKKDITSEVEGFSDGGFMPLLASAIECAKIHDVDVSSITDQQAPVKKPAEINPAAKPVPAKPAKSPAAPAPDPKPSKKPAAKPVVKPSGKDAATEIITYLDKHDGSANIADLYASFQGSGIEINVAEASIISLQGEGKIVIDGEMVTRA